MRRTIGLVTATIIGAVLLAAYGAPSAAQRYSLKSLRGTYVGGIIEVRQYPVKTGPVEYCDTAGTFTFDGAGKGSSSLTRRCSIAGTVVDDLTLTYKVASDGSASILFSSGTSGRFQLALNGDLAFITATGDPDPVVLVHQGHFARRD